MIDQTSMMIQTEARRYASDLQRWTTQVTMARCAQDAMRIASQRPQPGRLLRGMGGITSGDRSRAENTVERHLMSLVAKMTPDQPGLITLMRSMQGHFPKVWKELDALRRKGHSENG